MAGGKKGMDPELEVTLQETTGEKQKKPKRMKFPKKPPKKPKNQDAEKAEMPEALSASLSDDAKIIENEPEAAIMISDENEAEVDKEADSLISDKNEAEVDKEADSLISDENEPEVDKEADSLISDENEPEVDKEAEGLISDENEPEVDKESEGLISDENEPEVDKEAEGLISDENEAEAIISEDTETWIDDGKEQEPAVNTEAEASAAGDSETENEELLSSFTDLIKPDVAEEDSGEDSDEKEDPVFSLFNASEPLTINAGQPGTTSASVSGGGAVADGEEPSEEEKKDKKAKKDKTSDGVVLIDVDSADLSAKLGTAKKKKKKSAPRNRGLMGIPFSVYVITAAVLALALLGSGSWLFIKINQTRQDTQEARDESRIYLNNTGTNSNAQNVIYCEADLSVGGEVLTMSKAVIDNSATVLYFKEDIDFSAISLEVRDTSGKKYGYDASYISEDGTVNCPEGGVRFEPFQPGVMGFYLTATDIKAGVTEEFEFAFQNVHGMTAEKGFDRVTSVRDSDNSLIGTIYSTRFASTASTIFFTMENKEDDTRYIPETMGSTVSLIERGVEIRPIREAVVTEDTDGSVMSRIDFRPISWLTGNVEFEFTNLYRPLPINSTVGAVGLYMNPDPANFVIFEALNYKIVLERVLPYTDGSFQFVFHSEDVTVPVTGPDDRSNRREVMLDCEAEITLMSGEKLNFPGIARSSKEVGSNLIFKVQDSPYAEEIAAGRYREFNIFIKSALMREPDISVKLDLNSGYLDGPDSIDSLRSHLRIQNDDKDSYGVSILAYEKINNEHRAFVREVWIDVDGQYHVRTRELQGTLDEFSLRLSLDRVINESVGLK